VPLTALPGMASVYCGCDVDKISMITLSGLLADITRFFLFAFDKIMTATFQFSLLCLWLRQHGDCRLAEGCF
jgi:hypothetical protein